MGEKNPILRFSETYNMVTSLLCTKKVFAKCLKQRKHSRFGVVQNEVDSFLVVKLDVTGQLTVTMGINAQWKARMPLLPAEKREVGLTISVHQRKSSIILLPMLLL